MSPDITSGCFLLSRKIKVFTGFLLMFFCTGGVLEKQNFMPKKFNPIATPKSIKANSPDSRVVIDTRQSWKYFIGHIPGAVRISDWKQFTEIRNGVRGLLINDPNWIARKLRQLGISREKTLIVYGDPTDPWRTDGRFFWMFHYYGFEKVALLDGGYKRWIKEGEDTESGTGMDTVPSKLLSEDIHVNKKVLADWAWISKRLQSQNLGLIDNRTLKEYEGATPYGSPRGGHIPGAVHIDWREFFDKNGLLKERSEIINILNRRNIHSELETAVYCTGGVRSGMAYFVLKTLGFPVRNYDGSWWDWSRQSILPAEL